MSQKDLKKLADTIYHGLKRKGLSHGEVIALLANITGNVTVDMQEGQLELPPLKSVS